MRSAPGFLDLAVLLLLSGIGVAGVVTSARADERGDRHWSYLENLSWDETPDQLLMELRGFADEFPDDPRAPTALVRVAERLDDLGRTREAIDALERVESEHPYESARAEASLLLASLLESEGRTGEATEVYRRVVHDLPTYDGIDVVQLRLADLLVRRGQVDSARKIYARLIGGAAGDETVGRAMIGLASTDLSAGRSTTALARFDRVAERCPGTRAASEASMRAAAILRERGAIVEAGLRYRRVLEGTGQDDLRAPAHVEMGEMLLQTDPVAALEAFEAAVEEVDDGAWDERARRGVVGAALASGNHRLVRDGAERYLARHASHTNADAVRLAVALADLRDGRDRGSDALRALIASMDPDVAYEALAALATSAESADSQERALGLWRQAEARAPDAARRVDALLSQSRVLVALERPHLAAETALIAHDVTVRGDQKARALLWATRAYVTGRERAQALAMGQRVLREHPLTPEANAARHALRTIERQSGLDPRAAALELAELAEHTIIEPAQRSYDIALIRRDRLGDIDTALDLLDRAIDQATRPEQRGRFELEFGRTLELQAYLRGVEGDLEGAMDSHRRARRALGSAMLRAPTERSAQHARVLLVAIELAERVRPERPWEFDGWTGPLIGALGAAEDVDVTSADLDTVRTLLRTARGMADTRDQRAWIRWRQAELVREPVATRLEMAKEALSMAPSEDLQWSIRTTIGHLQLAAGDVERARREFMRVVEGDDFGEVALSARYGLGLAHRRDERYAEAGQAFDLVASVVPETRRGQYALLLAGDCAFYGGEDRAAERRYRRLIDDVRGSVYVDDALYRLGLLLEREGRMDAAIDPLRRVVEEMPDSRFRGRSFAALGRIEAAKGRLDEAIRDYEEWTRLEPTRAARQGAWMQIAAWHLENGEPHASLLWLDRRLMRNAPDPESMGLRVRAMADLSDVDGASAVVRRMEAGFPDDHGAIAAARLDVAVAMRGQNDLERSLDVIRRAESEAPTDELRARGAFERGLTYARMEYGREAIEAWESAQDVAPTSHWAADALEHRARWALRRGDTEAAQQSFATFIDRFPRDPRVDAVRLDEAATLRTLGRHDEALERYQTVLESDADAETIDEILLEVARSHLALGQTETAVITFRRVAPYLNGDAAVEVQTSLGEALSDLGRHEEAARAHLTAADLLAAGSQAWGRARLAAAEELERGGLSDSARTVLADVVREVGGTTEVGRRALSVLGRIDDAIPARR